MVNYQTIKLLHFTNTIDKKYCTLESCQYFLNLVVLDEAQSMSIKPTVHSMKIHPTTCMILMVQNKKICQLYQLTIEMTLNVTYNDVITNAYGIQQIRNNLEIIDHSKNWFVLLFKEALGIKSCPLSLDFDYVLVTRNGRKSRKKIVFPFHVSLIKFLIKNFKRISIDLLILPQLNGQLLNIISFARCLIK